MHLCVFIKSVIIENSLHDCWRISSHNECLVFNPLIMCVKFLPLFHFKKLIQPYNHHPPLPKT